MANPPWIIDTEGALRILKAFFSAAGVEYCDAVCEDEIYRSLRGINVPS